MRFFKRKKGSKYFNKKTVIDGIKFDSKKEAKRYGELKALADKGKIGYLNDKVEIVPGLKVHVPFILQDSFKDKNKKTHRPIRYEADFFYFDFATGEWIAEDVKGYRTDIYRLKKKLFMKKYPEINFIES